MMVNVLIDLLSRCWNFIAVVMLVSLAFCFIIFVAGLSLVASQWIVFYLNTLSPP